MATFAAFWEYLFFFPEYRRALLSVLDWAANFWMWEVKWDVFGKLIKMLKQQQQNVL